MARVLLLVALCFLPAVVLASRPNPNPFVVQGYVSCDPCRAGFETPASTGVADAKVKLVCKRPNSDEEAYSQVAKTDSTGAYKFVVKEDHGDQICDCMLLESSQPDCAKISPGRERARVVLTGYNGIASNTRYANNMLFEREEPLSSCTQIMKMYQLDDDDQV